MSVEIKLLFTIGATVVVAILLIFVKRGDSGEASARLWRGGASDPVRLLIMKPDGTFRRYTKPAIAILFVAWLGMIWVVL
jgi:hypothetical protein